MHPRKLPGDAVHARFLYGDVQYPLTERAIQPTVELKP